MILIDRVDYHPSACHRSSWSTWYSREAWM